jgi:type I restriction enzyme, S subunit
MSGRLPLVPLREVLEVALDKVPVDASTEYPMSGVYSFGRGLMRREPLLGANTTYKCLHRLHADDFVFSQLKGWEGALARVSSSFDGWFLSPQFITFRAHTERLDIGYLELYCRQAAVWERLRGTARGMGARRDSVSPDQFLSLELPLPPLDEQRRIVARIDELAAKIEEARGLRREAVLNIASLIPSTLHLLFESGTEHWKPMPMMEAVEIADRQVNPSVLPYSALPHISGENMESRTCWLLPYRTAEEDAVKSGNYLFSPGTILYSKIRPYLQKAVFVDFEGVCSADVYPIKVINEKLDARFVMWSLVAGSFTEYANRISGRTRMPKLNRAQLFGFALRYPPLEEQRRIVENMENLRGKVRLAKHTQSETAAELDALLPSILDRAFRGELA